MHVQHRYFDQIILSVDYIDYIIKPLVSQDRRTSTCGLVTNKSVISTKGNSGFRIIENRLHTVELIINRTFYDPHFMLFLVALSRPFII